MTTFTATGVSAAQTITNVGSITVTLTNTSSFIGTVFVEGSPDGGQSWTPASSPLIVGTMVAGPLTFDIPTPVVSMQIRLHCTKYTSGTLTYSFTTPKAVPVTVGQPGYFPNCIAINGCTISSGAGAPTGVQPNGSLYMRTDGSANTRLYVSEGAGTWSAIASS